MDPENGKIPADVQAHAYFASFAKPDGLSPVPTPYGPDIFETDDLGLNIDDNSAFCRAIREINSRNNASRCRKSVSEIDDAMGALYALNGMYGNIAASRDSIAADSRSYCGISDNCTHLKFGNADAFDEIARETLKYYETPMADRSEILTDPHILTVLDSLGGKNDGVKGHERKHDHPLWALVNIVYTYARFYKEEHPSADLREIAEQTKLWYNENGRKERLTRAAERIQQELDCVERDYNLDESCYPIEPLMYRFLTPVLSNMRNEVEKRTADEKDAR